MNYKVGQFIILKENTFVYSNILSTNSSCGQQHRTIDPFDEFQVYWQQGMGTGKQWLLGVYIAFGSGDMDCLYSLLVASYESNLILTRPVPKSTATTSFLMPGKTFTLKPVNIGD